MNQQQRDRLNTATSALQDAWNALRDWDESANLEDPKEKALLLTAVSAIEQADGLVRALKDLEGMYDPTDS